jgi:two-component system LytT family response regulator
VSAPRALIVDDEPLARETLRGLLRRDGSVVVAGECGTGAAAVEAIRRERPDIVFLDVQMPDLDGFSVLERVAGDHVPVVVFVTAWDRYAVRAFDVHAVDYLLKPFDDARFFRALRRAKRSLEGEGLRDRGRALLGLLEERAGAAPPSARLPFRRLVVRSGSSLVFLQPEDVDWIEAADYYVQLHVGPSVHLLRESLHSLEARLDPAEFVRIHRSAIVNLDRVQAVRAERSGQSVVVLADGTCLKLSRRRRPRLERLVRAGDSGRRGRA